MNSFTNPLAAPKDSESLCNSPKFEFIEILTMICNTDYCNLFFIA
jgi:hypothetical protein